MKDAGFSLMETLTPTQAIYGQSLLLLPTNKVRNLRVCLSNMNMNIFPSEKQLRKEKAPCVSHIKVSLVESGFIGLKRKKLEEDDTPPFITVKVLQTYIEEVINRESAGFSNDDEQFGGKR